MPERPSTGPRPACVEDFDDDRNSVLPDTRAFAKTVKDGSDSGYSSRTGTVDGERADARKLADMKSQAAQIERERQPYSGGPGVRRRESVSQQKPIRPKAPETAHSKDVEKKFCHPPSAQCWSCDKVGYHMTQEELDDIRARLSGQAPKPQSPKAARKPSTQQVKDRDVEAKLRQTPSYHQARTPMQFPPSATQPMPASYASPSGFYAPPVYHSPMTPVYSSQPYNYNYPPTPSTPGNGLYAPQPGPQEYFSQQPIPEIRPPNPRRRSSVYEGQEVPRPRRETIEPDPPRRADPRLTQAVVSKKESRPSMPQHQSNRSIEEDRYEQDRCRMPPPERPVKTSELARRPSMKKSYTHDDDTRYEMSRSRHDIEDIAEKRRSRGPRDYDHDEYAIGVRQSDAANRQPPTPYSQPAEYSPNRAMPRPSARHSVSYSDARHVETIAKSAAMRDTTQRRATTPLTNTDAKLADAEAYQQKHSSSTSDKLTEKIRSNSSKAPSRSDAGSNYSRRESQYSGSKTSTAAKKARPESIVIEANNKDRLSIQIPGGPTIVFGPDKERPKEKDRRKEQKLLENTTTSGSAVSQSSTSRSRAATSSHASSDRGRDREYGDRRSAHVIESRPPASPMKTSSKTSRATSRARATSDRDGGRRRQSSVAPSDRFSFGG